MRSVNIYEAKTRLSALIQAVERGEEIVITNRNRPVARLVPPLRHASAPCSAPPGPPSSAPG